MIFECMVMQSQVELLTKLRDLCRIQEKIHVKVWLRSAKKWLRPAKKWTLMQKNGIYYFNLVFTNRSTLKPM